MAYKFNPFTGTLGYYEPSNFKGTLTSAPSSPSDGDWYINSTDDTKYTYYGGKWNAEMQYAQPSGRAMGPLGITYA